MTELPRRVGVRIIDGAVLLVDIDDEHKTSHDFGSIFSDLPLDSKVDCTVVIKGIEIAFTALGYIADTGRMWMEDDTYILHFYRDKDDMPARDVYGYIPIKDAG